MISKIIISNKCNREDSSMKRPVDNSVLLRYSFLHCFFHIYKIIKAVKVSCEFTEPRFKLFSELTADYSKESDKALLKNIIKAFLFQILLGAIVTIVYSSLNLAIPELIRMFMWLMHQKNPLVEQVKSSYQFLQILLLIQIFRIFFGQHRKRLFHQLAIMVESSLAKKLIKKSLTISRKVKQKTLKSQVLQLQNVDLKLVFIMIQNAYLLFETPFTIFVAILMLFYESRVYGLIGIYWFVIMFLIQRELDGHMTHCNETKLRLIEQRSEINYELLEHMYEAKMIGWEDAIIEINNDYFIEQNEDHRKFYFYASLYDITILMLPVLVVVTICIYDMTSTDPITVQQVYLMLELLTICYVPMKGFRTLTISIHDGLHSLKRLQKYFNLKERQQLNHRVIDENLDPGTLIIQQKTVIRYDDDLESFHLLIRKHIQLHPGQRLILLGRKYQGRTTLIEAIVGTIQKIAGKVAYNGVISYVPEAEFFTKQSVRKNIAFFDQSVSMDQISKVCKDLGITDQLSHQQGLQTPMNDPNSFSKSLRAKISIARLLCKQADIYVLDRPFASLDYAGCKKVDSYLRQLQRKGKTVIIAPSEISFMKPTDKIAILNNGQIRQFDSFITLKNDPKSLITYFFKGDEQIVTLTEQSPLIKTKQQFESQVYVSQSSKVSQNFGSMHKLESSETLKSLLINNKMPEVEDFAPNTKHILLDSFFKFCESKVKDTSLEEQSKYSIRKHLKRFLTCVPLKESIFILVIIACAQLLHVFIHFFIGHLEEDNEYSDYTNMVLIEVILTIGLALVLYYEGQVSSMIAIMQGNILYRESLTALSQKRFEWFNDKYKTLTADKFNHDYEEIFVATHGFLGIYKNVIILLVTIEFLSSDSYTSIMAFLIVSGMFISIFMTFRRMQRKITAEHYNYKYKYVRVLEESIDGAHAFQVFHKSKQLLLRAEKQYRKLASYKLATSYTMHGLSICCDIASVVLLCSAVAYGLELKMHQHRTNLAIIATSIHLLMNGMQVLKSLVQDTINFETFFTLNLIPFMEIKDQHETQKNVRSKTQTCAPHWDIYFDFVNLHGIDQANVSSHLFFKIPQGQKVLLYQTNATARDMLVLGISCNLPMFLEPKYYDPHGTIKIGNKDIRSLKVSYLRNRIAVIMNKNFFMTGTIRQNLYRKVVGMQDMAHKFIRVVKLDKDIPDFEEKGLDAKMAFQIGKVNHQITKKFALVRILLRRPRIVVIKDTPAFIGSLSIIDILDRYVPECTIIKISGKLEASANMKRIVSMVNGQVMEDVSVDQILKNRNSPLGKLLKKINLEGYIFMNKGSKLY